LHTLDIDDAHEELTAVVAFRRNLHYQTARKHLRHQCLFANVIPWWDGTRAVSSEQRMRAGQGISELIELLPALRAIVLVGRTAA
jgi:hypothetical protein